MATNHTFKVRQSKGAEPVKFSRALPTYIDETDLIEAAYGSVERMIDRANAQWTVDVATGVRERLPDEDEAADYVASYCDDGRRAAPRKIAVSSEDVEKQGFTPEQIAFMRSKGIEVPTA